MMRMLVLMSLLLSLAACQSTIHHEVIAEDYQSTDTELISTTEPILEAPEPLVEDPIAPINSTELMASFTPASYYHSPDPPENVPEYVPSVFFHFDSWALSEKGKEILELTANQLEKDQNSTLIIEGHCDIQGSEGYNLVLGKKRAHVIQDYLVNLGIAKDRLRPVSFGETHPVCFENHETCHSVNRRGYLVSSSDSDSSLAPQK